MKPTRPNIRRGGTYPLEFREEAVRYWLSSGQTLAAVVADLGLTPETLRSWRRQMESSGSAHELMTSDPAPHSPSQELSLAREIGQLKHELEAMTRQRDILPSAISIFSHEQERQRRFELIQNITQATVQTSACPLSSASTSAFKVRETCAALGDSCSGFYAHRHKAQRQRRREDRILSAELEQVFDDSAGAQERGTYGGTYGSPRLMRALRKRGFRTSKTCVSRLMKSRGLQPVQKRRVRVKTTRSNPRWPVAPHLLLEAPLAYQPGERFHSDITYISTDQGCLVCGSHHRRILAQIRRLGRGGQHGIAPGGTLHLQFNYRLSICRYRSSRISCTPTFCSHSFQSLALSGRKRWQSAPKLER